MRSRSFYLHDGSFEGFITALSEASAGPAGEKEILCEEDFEGDLFISPVTVATDPAGAEEFLRAVKAKISPRALGRVYYAYLSEAREAGTLAHRYLALGFETGKNVDALHHDERVRAVRLLSRKVTCEAHRLKGLLRFRRIEGGLYYAPCEPDHNVAGLLAPHFAARLADRRWAIHDLRRGLAVLYDGREWSIASAERESAAASTEEETFYRGLWRLYFEKAAVPDRKNPERQRRFMPRRYWKHLTEMTR